MPKQLQTQIEDIAAVRKILQRLEHTINLPDGKIVETFLIYLPCKGNECDLSELLRLIKDVLFIHFSLSISEIEDRTKIANSTKSRNELFKDAIANTSKNTAKGELGELLLFTLLEVYFNAPKILTKMSLKTSPKVAYHGVDAVHAQFIDEELRLYMGESKLYTTFSNAKRDAIESLQGCFDEEKYKHELRLIKRNIDSLNLDAETRKLLLELTNPFSKHDKEKLLHTPCFIGFADPDLFSDDFEAYMKNYKDKASKHVTSFYTTLSSTNLLPEKTPLLLLPFSCVDSFADAFIAYMGIANE